MEKKQEKIQKIEDITWIWDNIQGEPKASFFTTRNRTEIHLTKSNSDRWFSPNLENGSITFEPHKFRPRDLNIFARFKDTYYQQQVPDCYDSVFMFSFSENDAIIKQEGKWIKVKQLKKQPTITQIKDFLF